jgi:hypothetical protein
MTMLQNRPGSFLQAPVSMSSNLLLRIDRVAAMPPSRLSAIGGSVLALSLVLLPAVPGANGSCVYLPLLVGLAALAVARAEPESHRLISLNLFIWALLVRVVAAAGFHMLALREGGPFLGPDSATYFRLSGDLAARNFELDVLPVVHFGSYDVAHYYLFAAAQRWAGADLFGLQILNGALLALAVSLTYGFTRVVLPGAALFVGVATALHPSLIVVSAIDLLKDPSILFATVLLIWVVVRLAEARRLGAMILLASAGVAAALYLRTGRFYTFAYLELACVTAGIVMLISRRRVFKARAAVVIAAAIFVTAETVPARWAWPPAPVMVADTVAFALGSPGLRYYAFGLFDRVQMRPSEERPVGPQGGPRVGLARLLAYPANLIRRIYGPFIWIPPETWSFRSLQAGDYLLYPGMLVWYALIPAVITGIGITAVRLWRDFRQRRRAARDLRDLPATDPQRIYTLAVLWLFCAVYFAQYLSINLSYRQRDVMLPVLLVFAWIGAEWARQRPGWQRVYAAYWLALGGMAIAHLVVRAVLGA